MPHEVRPYREQLEGRTMLVRKAKVVPMEAIVRGYITGELIRYPDSLLEPPG
jgi:phosphoribosylaminoimidazole-succinocarboxamide synthase